MSHEKLSQGDEVFGSFSQNLQVIFDEAILDGDVTHETWSHAWGRAVAYAWESDANKELLLSDPVKVLSQFNYSLPGGVDLRVVDANRSEDEFIKLEKTKNELKYNRENLNPKNFYAYLVDSNSIEACEINNGFVKFILIPEENNNFINHTKKWTDVPINGWVTIPNEGILIKLPSGRLWYITKENFDTPSTQLDAEKKSISAQLINDFIKSKPAYLNLASTVIMKLPPKPNLESQNMALMDYDALGKIYPFTT